jgi:hypothetical protein
MRAHMAALPNASARSTSTPASRKTVDSDWICPLAAGSSKGTPAQAATSASPDASTTTAASTRPAPPLLNSVRARTRRSPSSSTPVTQVCSSTSTPASSASVSQSRLSTSGS